MKKKKYICTKQSAETLTKKPTIMKYSVVIEKDDNGWYVGQCCEVPSAMSQGKTLKELMANMKEAIELAILCQKEDNKIV